jgi:hypothetical protein
MMILGADRETELKKLGLSNSLMKLTEGEFVHDELEFRCFKSKYALEGDAFAPKTFDLVPLWESDSSITGFYKKGDSTFFVHYYIDDINDIKVIGESVSDLIEFLVSEYVDYDYESEVRNLLLNS